jgi:hypothetical protein
MSKKIRAIGTAVVVAVWALLTGFAWFIPSKDISEAERRPLAQFPAFSADTLLTGDFMEDFESYTLDQFPGRDLFRQLKSTVHYNLFGQRDNNGIYIADGYAAKLDYPINTDALQHAMERLNYVYETYFAPHGSKAYAAVIPDKGYYLAEKNGYPAMDYGQLFQTVKDKMPWATYIDLADTLDVTDYYFTDTHWRQEKLEQTAKALCDAMGVTAPKAEDFTKTTVERPFYGVYYGQAALPMEPEIMYLMESPLLKDCRVYSYETGKYNPVYDMDKLTGKDPYDVYLSGAQSLLRIENPNAKTDRELMVFRDSFGSSIVPLLVQDYKTVTLVDIRYLDSRMLGNFLEFNGQDVLFLYSTLVLNSGTTLK